MGRFAPSLIDQRAQHHAVLFLRGLDRSPCFSVLKRLAYFLSAARIRDLWVSIRWRKDLDISQGTCAWNDLGGSEREPVCYRLGRNSSLATVICRVSSTEVDSFGTLP